MLQITPRGEHQRCPYCHGALELEGRQSCAGCGALYHRECLLEELGRCAVLGCGEPVSATESSAPFAGALRQLLEHTVGRVPGVEPALRREPYFRAGETPMARVRTSGEPFLLTDVGVWRSEALCFDFAQIARLQWKGPTLEVRLGQDFGVEPFGFTPGPSIADRVAAFALERLLTPLAGYLPGALPDRCPQCHQVARQGETVYACDGCGASYHPKCLHSAGKCLVPGCPGQRANPRAALDWLEVLGHPRPDVPIASPERPASETAQPGAACARCARDFASGDLTYRCSGCGVALHAECMRTWGSCKTAGCSAASADACRYSAPPLVQTATTFLWVVAAVLFAGGFALLAGGGQTWNGLVCLILGVCGLGVLSMLYGEFMRHSPLNGEPRSTRQDSSE